METGFGFAVTDLMTGLGVVATALVLVATFIYGARKVRGLIGR